MEIESEDQIPQNIPSISGVSQELNDVSTDSTENDSKKISPQQNTDSVSEKNAVQSDQTVTNGVTTPEPKTDSVEEVLQLTSNNMTEGILAEIDEPITKASNLNSDLLSSDLPAMKVQRQSPLQKNSVGNEGLDKECSHITKEDVKTQDFVIDSKDITNGGSKNCEALENTRDCVNTESLECSQDGNQADCKTQIPSYEKQVIFNVAVPKTVTNAKDVTMQDEVCEALDLSLPKKKTKDNKEKCKWVIDSGYEGSLLMEVDEIEDDNHYVEVEQDEDDVECWFPLRSDMNNFHLENWNQHSDTNIAIQSTACISDLSPDPKDTLLIDDQGIPYTLTPDGHKIPQIDSSDMPKDFSEQISPEFAQFEDKDEISLPVHDADRVQEFLPNLPLGDSSPDLSTETSEGILTVEKQSSHDTTVEAQSTATPAISSLPSLPIQIMASNTGSNTPILLLPQSQLQTLSSTASNSNPGLMALSLPLALAQNSQSSPVFLVLASPQVSCGIQSSTFSGQLSQVSSTTSLALPIESGSLGLKLEPVSCTTTTANLSGQKKPCNLSSTPTSPTAPSSTSSATSKTLTKQLKSDPCSDTPTSFQEALLRLAVSAVQKLENQSTSIETPSVVTPSSCTEETQSRSSSATHTPEKQCKTEQELSPISEPASMLGDQTDPMLSPVSGEGLPPPSSSSPLRPESPIFPSNHPKNTSDSQTLGPRRILYCQYCPRVFYYLSDLERHSITHSQSKPHVCQLCGKAFKRSSHLERHKHIHTGQRNFMCQLCPRRFREAAELTRHQRVHTGEKPFQCLLCHMRFAERNTLRRHTKRKHQGQQQEAINAKVKAETAGVSLLGIQGQQEENAEWYSSTMTEMDSDNDTGGE